MLGGGAAGVAYRTFIGHEHEHDHAQIVIDRNEGSENPQRRQQGIAGADGGVENGEFADETGGRRHSGQGEEKNRQGGAAHRIAPADAVKIVMALRLLGGVGKRGDDTESAEIGGGINDQIEKNGSCARRRRRRAGR